MSDYPRTKLKVHALDDNPADLVLLERALSRLKDWDVRMTGVTSTEDLLAKLRDETGCDLIFVDYRLGAESGVDVIRYLRDGGIKLPIIMLTGAGDERVAAESFRAGAGDYLIKDDINTDSLARCVNHVMAAYRRERKLSHDLKSAMTDSLTGLMNKEYLMKRLAAEVERTKRYHNPLSFLMIDLDHFKKVNDTYGHLAGDEVLRRVAMCIRADLRGTDFGARFGGEEFSLMLPETTLRDARHIAERLRERIEELRVTYGSHEIRVTTSVGVACYSDGLVTPEDIIQAADEALYRAKREGRNCVRVACPSGKVPVTTSSHC
jgi:diguanylate cyclase (GGDEF)-like protein